MKMNKLLSGYLLTFAACLWMGHALAKEIVLYQSPDVHSTIVGKVDLAKGVIPIFSPKDSDWIKIANPQNGEVGWIKSKDLTADGHSAFSFSTKYFANDGNDNNDSTYQVIELGNMTPQQQADWQKQMDQLQAKQAAIQKSLNQTIGQMLDSVNELYHSYWQAMQTSGMPMMMPVVVVPTEQPSAPAHRSTSSPNPKQVPGKSVK